MREHGTTPQAIILEPVGRNTAPAVAVAALVALDRARKSKGGNDADPILLVLPADHVIRDVQAFQSAVVPGSAAAAAGKLVTFGVVPDRPETGYGYIRRARATARRTPVQQFVEKPDAATAKTYVESGEYYWNSGMFMFRARAYLAELKRHAPAMLSACEDAVAAATRDLDFTRLASGGVRRLPERFHRLCGDGEDGFGGGRAARRRLERRGFLVGPAGRPAARRPGQRRDGRRAGRGFERLLPAFDQPPDRRRGAQGSRRRRDQGCRAGGAARPRAGRQGAGGPAQGAGPLRDGAAPRGIPARGAATTASTTATASR